MATMTLAEIFERVASAGTPTDAIQVEGSEAVEAFGLLVYWDAQDPQNEGWAYRFQGESGPLDSLEELDELLTRAKNER